MNGSSDIIIKLFDTLKDATEKSERTMQTLITQQQTLTNNISNMPIKEIRDEIKDHITSAQEERIEISKKIDKVDGKVSKMIIVVLITFSLLSASYLFIKSAYDYNTVVQQYQEKTE